MIRPTKIRQLSQQQKQDNIILCNFHIDTIRQLVHWALGGCNDCPVMLSTANHHKHHCTGADGGHYFHHHHHLHPPHNNHHYDCNCKTFSLCITYVSTTENIIIFIFITITIIIIMIRMRMAHMWTAACDEEIIASWCRWFTRCYLDNTHLSSSSSSLLLSSSYSSSSSSLLPLNMIIRVEFYKFILMITSEVIHLCYDYQCTPNKIDAMVDTTQPEYSLVMVSSQNLPPSTPTTQ